MTKLEEVARAIYCSVGVELDDAMPTARAVIEALREPSTAMLDASWPVQGILHTWKNMIDAILNE